MHLTIGVYYEATEINWTELNWTEISIQLSCVSRKIRTNRTEVCPCIQFSAFKSLCMRFNARCPSVVDERNNDDAVSSLVHN